MAVGTEAGVERAIAGAVLFAVGRAESVPDHKRPGLIKGGLGAAAVLVPAVGEEAAGGLGVGRLGPPGILQVDALGIWALLAEPLKRVLPAARGAIVSAGSADTRKGASSGGGETYVVCDFVLAAILIL